VDVLEDANPHLLKNPRSFIKARAQFVKVVKRTKYSYSSSEGELKKSQPYRKDANGCDLLGVPDI
jgi:hypothetical protein